MVCNILLKNLNQRSSAVLERAFARDGRFRHHYRGLVSHVAKAFTPPEVTKFLDNLNSSKYLTAYFYLTSQRGYQC